MQLARTYKQNPREIASKIVEELEEEEEGGGQGGEGGGDEGEGRGTQGGGGDEEVGKKIIRREEMRLSRSCSFVTADDTQ